MVHSLTVLRNPAGAGAAVRRLLHVIDSHLRPISMRFGIREIAVNQCCCSASHTSLPGAVLCRVNSKLFSVAVMYNYTTIHMYKLYSVPNVHTRLKRSARLQLLYTAVMTSAPGASQLITDNQ